MRGSRRRRHGPQAWKRMNSQVCGILACMCGERRQGDVSGNTGVAWAMSAPSCQWAQRGAARTLAMLRRRD
jgi:hypothetical protein